MGNHGALRLPRSALQRGPSQTWDHCHLKVEAFFGGGGGKHRPPLLWVRLRNYRLPSLSVRLRNNGKHYSQVPKAPGRPPSPPGNTTVKARFTCRDFKNKCIQSILSKYPIKITHTSTAVKTPPCWFLFILFFKANHWYNSRNRVQCLKQWELKSVRLIDYQPRNAYLINFFNLKPNIQLVCDKLLNKVPTVVAPLTNSQEPNQKNAGLPVSNYVKAKNMLIKQ